MNTVQQIKRAHRTEGGNLSLKAFARERGVLEVITRAHKAANKPTSDAKKARTRAAASARSIKKSK